MKLKGHIKTYTPKQNGSELTIIIERHPDLTDLLAKTLTVEVKPWKKNRTLDQNALLWSMIGDIDVEVNGRRSKEGSLSIYAQSIKMARIKTEFLLAMPDAIPILREKFRVVEERGHRLVGETKMIVCECFLGSSNFNTKEMIDLIETVLDYAEEVGLNTISYRDQWRGILE